MGSKNAEFDADFESAEKDSYESYKRKVTEK
jgi:hypothetical protein